MLTKEYEKKKKSCNNGVKSYTRELHRETGDVLRLATVREAQTNIELTRHTYKEVKQPLRPRSLKLRTRQSWR